MTKNKPVINFAKLYENERYRGKFVAVEPYSNKVIAHANTPKKASDEAEKKGAKDAIITIVPADTNAHCF
jgi:small nuclear ribonucleoprotein (snRNP)-like protein